MNYSNRPAISESSVTVSESETERSCGDLEVSLEINRNEVISHVDRNKCAVIIHTVEVSRTEGCRSDLYEVWLWLRLKKGNYPSPGLIKVLIKGSKGIS